MSCCFSDVLKLAIETIPYQAIYWGSTWKKHVLETWPAETELWTLQLCCFWSDHLGRTDTCSFLVFFLGIGSPPLSDSDLLLTDRRCSFLSWEPENTEKYWAASLTDFTRQIFTKTKHPAGLCFTNLVDYCGEIRERRSAAFLLPRSSGLRGSLSSPLLPPLPPLPHPPPPPPPPPLHPHLPLPPLDWAQV